MTGRRKFLYGGGALLALGGAGYKFGVQPIVNPRPPETGFSLSKEELAAARSFMAQNPIVDSHAHPGRTFLKDAENLSFKIRLYKALGGTFAERTIAEMASGGVDAAVFNGVADIQLLTLGKTGLTAERDYDGDEAWQSYLRQIANLRTLEERGAVRICLSRGDVMAAKNSGKTGMILAMEGADFLNGDLDRLQQVYDDGIRMLTLVHYHDNTIGTIMTGRSDKGLSAFGKEVVAAMNTAGIVIDLAHASEKMTRDVLKITTGPTVITHTHINTAELKNPRFIDRDIAVEIAATGGYIGAWPAGIGATTLAEFIDRIDFLVGAIGKEHVAIGSDMDANYKPVLETYKKMPLVVGALLKRGYTPEKLALIMGGNVLRVMEQVQAGSGA